MGQLGMMELVVIFVVALLVFGPKKLPELGKSLGKGLREFKRATDDLKSSWNDQVRDVEQTANEATSDLRETDREIKAEFNGVNGSQPKDTVPVKEETSIDARQN
jgi:TatA/E family protein of Tat protein translocase